MNDREIDYMKWVMENRDSDKYAIISTQDSEIAVYFCEERYYPAEPAVFNPIDNAHPGSPEKVGWEYCTGSEELDEWIDLNYAERMVEGVLAWMVYDREQQGPDELSDEREGWEAL